MIDVYLASPYSHKDAEVRNERHRAVVAALVQCCHVGVVAFSPIAHGHFAANEFGMRGDWEFWKRFDEQFIQQSGELWALKLPGWQDSRGLTAEVAIALDLGKRVVMVDPGRVLETAAEFLAVREVA